MLCPFLCPFFKMNIVQNPFCPFLYYSLYPLLTSILLASSPVVSMFSSWNFYSVSMIFLWDSYGLRRGACDMSMGFL